jgi:hypothetical protein
MLLFPKLCAVTTGATKRAYLPSNIIVHVKSCFYDGLNGVARAYAKHIFVEEFGSDETSLLIDPLLGCKV